MLNKMYDLNDVNFYVEPHTCAHFGVILSARVLTFNKELYSLLVECQTFISSLEPKAHR